MENVFTLHIFAKYFHSNVNCMNVHARNSETHNASNNKGSREHCLYFMWLKETVTSGRITDSMMVKTGLKRYHSYSLFCVGLLGTVY